MIVKLNPQQHRKAHELASCARRLAAQVRALTAAAFETFEFRQRKELRLAQITPRYNVVRAWWERIGDKNAQKDSPGGIEWAQLERERSELVAAIDEAKAETERLHAEASRLNQFGGIYREIVEELSKWTQDVELRNVARGAGESIAAPSIVPARSFG